MGRTRLLAAVLAGLLLAVPASAGTGSELPGVIKRAEQLRGLKTTRPLAVATLGAAGLRRIVVRELAHERHPREDAAWDDALHLLGVLKPGQSLEHVQRGELTGQVAGLYVPASGRLYVLGGGGAAPRSVIAHEVTHALQNQHFHLTRGVFAHHPSDHDGELAALALIEGDATEVQSRYVATLSAGDLVSELARTLGSMPSDSKVAKVPYLQGELTYPYTAGLEFVRAVRARGGQRLLDRAFRHPPRTTAAVLDPARYLAGDPPARPVALPPGTYDLATTFGAEDLVALTGEDGQARSWLGGRLGVGPQGLQLRLAARRAASVAAALRHVLPASAAIAFRGQLVCVRIVPTKASGQPLSCR
ncbi:MAG TPA: hypothetical protein VFD90_14540 [Gaiellales bacterium]|nr:hypothetical protein [Gaiellales bacterium]